MTVPTTLCGDDLIVWPDDTNCWGDELHEMAFKGDDCRRLPYDTPEWHREYERLHPEEQP